MLIVTKGLPTFILLGFSLDGQNFSGHLYHEILGNVHMHTTYSDGAGSFEELIRAAALLHDITKTR